MSNTVSPQQTKASPAALALQQRVNTIKSLFDRALPELQKAAPRHITADRLIKVAAASLSRVEHLSECTQSSLLIALMTATELGLEPNTPLGHAYILPYKNTQAGGIYEAQFIPGYRGLVYLAFQSGEVNDIRSAVVKVGDTWRYRDARGGVDWEFAPSEAEDREEQATRLVYAVASMKGGNEHIEVMTRAQINAIAASSAGARSQKSPWHNHWEEMARKTVIKRLCKHLPLSPERSDLVLRAVEVDNRAAGEPAGMPMDIAEAMSQPRPQEDAPNVPAQAPALNADTRVPQTFVGGGGAREREPVVAAQTAPAAAPQPQAEPMSRADEVRAKIAEAKGAKPPPREPGTD
jgi:recombination protein RecT